MTAVLLSLLFSEPSPATPMSVGMFAIGAFLATSSDCRFDENQEIAAKDMEWVWQRWAWTVFAFVSGSADEGVSTKLITTMYFLQCVLCWVEQNHSHTRISVTVNDYFEVERYLYFKEVRHRPCHRSLEMLLTNIYVVDMWKQSSCCVSHEYNVQSGPRTHSLQTYSLIWKLKSVGLCCWKDELRALMHIVVKALVKTSCKIHLLLGSPSHGKSEKCKAACLLGPLSCQNWWRYLWHLKSRRSYTACSSVSTACQT